jgi:IclR family acetate operon transcriptional repressor
MATRKSSRKKKTTTVNASPDGKRYVSRAVAKALVLLEVLGKSRQSVPLTELAAAVKLTKTSAYRLLFTLEDAGYVKRDLEGRYCLRSQARSGVRDKQVARLLEVASPHMRDLVRELRETTGLAALFDNHIEAIAVVESPQLMRMGNTVGRILQPHASSLGKCITAFQSESRREHLVHSYGVTSYTPNTITDETVLAEEFARIREQGYATDRGETCLDGYCFGAPIRDGDGEVIAAISISIPRTRLEGMSTERVVEAISGAADSISAELGK